MSKCTLIAWIHGSWKSTIIKKIDKVEYDTASELIKIIKSDWNNEDLSWLKVDEILLSMLIDKYNSDLSYILDGHIFIKDTVKNCFRKTFIWECWVQYFKEIVYFTTPVEVAHSNILSRWKNMSLHELKRLQELELGFMIKLSHYKPVIFLNPFSLWISKTVSIINNFIK